MVEEMDKNKETERDGRCYEKPPSFQTYDHSILYLCIDSIINTPYIWSLLLRGDNLSDSGQKFIEAIFYSSMYRAIYMYLFEILTQQDLKPS